MQPSEINKPKSLPTHNSKHITIRVDGAYKLEMLAYYIFMHMYMK